MAAGAGNLISGNTRDGVDLMLSLGLVLRGNRIGTDVSGGRALANGFGGVILSGFDTVIGGGWPRGRQCHRVQRQAPGSQA